MHPWKLDALLSPLLIATFSQEYLILLPITDVQFPALCSQILSLVVLAFLVNLVETFAPKGKNIFTWLLFRLLTMAVCMGLHLVVNWTFRTYLPNILVTYAPMILLLILCLCLMSGVVNLLLGLVIATANPFLGAMYTFFFSNTIGKNLTRAVLSAALTCGLFYLMEYAGFSVIDITHGALLTYIPFAAALIGVWFVFDYKL